MSAKPAPAVALGVPTALSAATQPLLDVPAVQNVMKLSVPRSWASASQRRLVSPATNVLASERNAT